MGPPVSYRPSMSALEQARMDGTGFCIRCATERDGVELDAENYECEACQDFTVFGVAYFLAAGAVAAPTEPAAFEGHDSHG